jgi:hypothetical protein
MTKYENGYSNKIKYWAEQYNEAFKANDIAGIKTAIAKLDYFTERHCVFLQSVKAPIRVGNIVRFKQGWMSVSKVTKNTVNLRGIYGGRVTEKNVPIESVTEDSAGYYEYYRGTDAYASM